MSEDISFKANYKRSGCEWKIVRSHDVTRKDNAVISHLLSQISIKCDEKAAAALDLDTRAIHDQAALFVCATLKLKPVKFGSSARSPASLDIIDKEVAEVDQDLRLRRPGPARIGFADLGKVMDSLETYEKSGGIERLLPPLPASAPLGVKVDGIKSWRREQCLNQFIRFVLIECGYAPYCETIWTAGFKV